ncbi:hypothetical protein LTR28_013580 [Elasticomyces elasticus]|nr:hypothetical protein LTR28_013580 [Elasticomyces elasticus]
MAPETSNPQPNGLLHDGKRIEKLLDEVLRIRDDVFDGTHPRIKLQKAAIEQLTKRQITNPDAIAHNHTQGHTPPVNGVDGRAQEPPFANGMTNAFSNSSAVILARDEPLLARLPKVVPGDATAAPTLTNPSQRANDKPSSSSGIDPIFLTKSDSLVRAETQLARQRRERELDAALHKRRNASHGQDSGLEPDPLSGLGNILNTALDLPDGHEQNSHHYTGEAANVCPSDREESEEYSPPAAFAFGEPKEGGSQVADVAHVSNHYTLQQNARHEIPTSPQYPIATNHMQQIAAPQPVRVSPLVVAKLPQTMSDAIPEEFPPQEQNRLSLRTKRKRSLEVVTHPQPPRRSPSTPPRPRGRQSPQRGVSRARNKKNRKRKREMDVADEVRQVPGRRIKPTPPPKIKDETLSPPPFTAALPPRSTAPEAVYERAPSRQPVVRAPRRTIDAVEDDNVYQRMPPPARRVVEQADIHFNGYHQYPDEEVSRQPVERQLYAEDPASIYIREPIERRYVPDYASASTQPYMSRAVSTRPEFIRNEIPSEYVSRQPSMQPPVKYVRRVDGIPTPVRSVPSLEYAPMPSQRYDRRCTKIASALRNAALPLEGAEVHEVVPEALASSSVLYQCPARFPEFLGPPFASSIRSGLLEPPRSPLPHDDMHKISNFTGQARHGWEKMTPSIGFGMSRPHLPHEIAPTAVKRSYSGPTSMSPVPTTGSSAMNLSFNVPFASNLAGPFVDEVRYASPGAFARWTHPEDVTEGTPNYKLPVHTENVDKLRRLCLQMSEGSGGRIQTNVTSSEPTMQQHLPGRPTKGLVTNVWIHGEEDVVQKLRARVLTETPISLRCAIVDVEPGLIMPQPNAVRSEVLSHLDEVASQTKTDVFILSPKQVDVESASFNGNLDSNMENRLRIAIYGDLESSEHARTRVLIMIDQLVSDVMPRVL